MSPKYEDKLAKPIKKEELSKSIKTYKKEILDNVMNDLQFIRRNRVGYLYGFTSLLLVFITITLLIITGVIPIPDGINSQFLFPLISGIFVQLIALMIIVFKYLFDPIREMLKHTMSLIADEKTPDFDSPAPLVDSSDTPVKSLSERKG